jgi:plasmid stabilization system protein ParE
MAKTKRKASKTYTLKLTEEALNNIDEITGYIAFIEHRPLTATKVGNKIFSTLSRIEKNPLAFRECQEIPTKNKLYRQAVCLSWLIIYKIQKTEIVVLGIIHSSRKPSRIKSLK